MVNRLRIISHKILPNVAQVTVGGAKFVDEGLSLGFGEAFLFSNDISKSVVDILGHGFGITADVDVSALFFEELVNAIRDFRLAHEVLDVYLFLGVTREGSVKFTLALFDKRGKFIRIDVILVTVTASEKEDVWRTW